MYDELSDSQIEDQLRRVPVPPELLSRLREACLPDDVELDAALRRLAPPPGLADRLQRVVEDEVLDDALREVPVPDDLLPRLRIIPQRRPRWRLRRFAVAASLLIVVLGSYFSALGGLLAAIHEQPDRWSDLAIIDLGPLRLNSSPMKAVRLEASDEADELRGPTVLTAWNVEPVNVELVRLDSFPEPGPAGSLIRDVRDGLGLSDDVLLMQWAALGSPQSSEEPRPELEQVRRAPASSVDLPLAPGYDRSFLLKSSTHPPVFPGQHARLEKVRVPLTTATDSLQRTRQLLSQGRLPDPREIRTEDFLAAVDYQFPPPAAAEVGIRTAAGPAVFGRQDHHLLQIGVQAAQSVGNRATHVAIVVDVSSSMRRHGRLDSVRHALQAMLAHFDSQDSLSLVAVNHEATEQIEFARRQHRDEILGAIGELRAGGGDNLVAGVRSALTVALEAELEADAARQLVLITDGEAALRDDEIEQLSDLFARAEDYQVRVTVLDLEDHQLSPADAVVEDFGLRSVTPSQMVWELVRLATEQSPLVARDARLSVTFNPRAVYAYRLVGHGPTAATGLGEAEVTIDLYSQQHATALFEIWLREDADNLVGWAEVRWVDPQTGGPRSAPRQRISRVQFADSHAETPLSLQTAAIAAEVGQRLRGVSDFEVRGRRDVGRRQKPDSWQDVLSAAARVHDRVAERPDFQELIELVRRIEELRKPNGLAGPDHRQP